jgi:hypothetical protein
MTGKAVLYCVSTAALLLAVNSAQQAQAQGGRGMRPRGVSPLMLLSREPVQKELALKPDQVEKVKDLARDVQDEFREEMSNSGIDFQGLQDLSREERAKKMSELQAKMAEINKKLSARFMPKANEILDKAQQTRLHEIAVQAAGASAFEDSEVVKDLGLTKEQQDKIKKIGEDFQHKMSEARESGGDRSEIMAKMTQLREEENAKTTEVLTKEQQSKFAEMKGKPFDTRSLFQRRRRAE